MVPETWSGDLRIWNAGGTSAGFPLQITYCWSGHKWFSGGPTPQWHINQNGAPGVTFADLELELRAAFATWECASGFDINYGGTTTRSSPGYADGWNVQYWVNTPWSDPNIIAVSTHYYIIATGQITEADVAYNGHDYTWTAGGAGNTMDIQAVAVHEDGHNIGLRDLYGTYDSQKTMYGLGNAGETHPRYLHEHDIVGAEFVYSHSGRANLTSTTPSGWWGPVVPHPFADATDSSAPLPAVLPGNQAAFVSFSESNTGLDCASPEGRVAYDLDGVSLGWRGWYRNPFLPGQVLKWKNLALTVRGGRHTIQLRHDYMGWIGESNESDNVYEAQFAWSPYGLADQTPVVRSAPPDPGTGTWNNCEGFQFTSNQYWGLVAVSSQNASDDYDVALFDDYAGSQTGYQTPLIYSGALAGKTDFVVANGNLLGPGKTYWAGAIGYDRVASSDVVVCQSNQVGNSLAPSETYGELMSYGPRYLVANQLAKVHEFYVSNVGYAYGISLDNTSGGANLNLAIVRPDLAYAARNFASGHAASNGPGGDEYYLLYPPMTGWYGVVVYKDGSADNGLAAEYELEVGLALSNLHPANATLDGPVIPRNDATASSGNAQVSGVLDGNAPSTWISWAFAQAGPNTIGSFHTGVYLDGEPAWIDGVSHIGPVPPLEFENFNRGPFEIRGGRHTLSVHVDDLNEVPEIDESDNLVEQQWIWSPLPTTRQVPEIREAPPELGSLVYGNNDATSFSRDPNFSWVVSVVGLTDHDDYDLIVLDDYSGSTVGFDNTICASYQVDGLVDFVVGHYSGSQATVYPAVRRYLAFNLDPYTIDQTDAAGREATDNGHWSGVALDQYRLADVYDLYLTGGQRYLLDLTELGPETDLRFAVFPELPGGVYGRGEASALSVPFGTGRQQQVFEATVDGWYPVVVFRGTNDFHDVPVMYDFRFEPTDMTGVDPEATPSAFALRSAAPNPMSSRTQISFALPNAGNVSLELFDVRGRRVRRLLDESYPPGVHSVEWNTRDERGHRVAAGTYWARLSMGMEGPTRSSRGPDPVQDRGLMRLPPSPSLTQTGAVSVPALHHPPRNVVEGNRRSSTNPIESDLNAGSEEHQWLELVHAEILRAVGRALGPRVGPPRAASTTPGNSAPTRPWPATAPS
jgi:hypothetical protein